VSNVFIDTAGWASLFIPTETYHLQAAEWFHQSQQRQQAWVTTNYVVAELVALLGNRQRTPRTTLFQYIDSIKLASYVEVVHLDARLDAAAWELCKSRPDKAWSLVDCSSFMVMQQMDIQAALTTDHHFEQAGFVRLLK
jgi:uncharacterized protein